MKYTDLTEVQQQEILKQANIATRIQKKNIEKDWETRFMRIGLEIYHKRSRWRFRQIFFLHGVRTMKTCGNQ